MALVFDLSKKKDEAREPEGVAAEEFPEFPPALDHAEQFPPVMEETDADPSEGEQIDGGPGELAPVMLGPETVDPLDIEAARARLTERFKGPVDDVVKLAEAVEVTNDEQNRVATEMVAQLSDLVKRLEKKRKEVIDGPDQFVRKVNATVKPWRDKLERAVKALKDKMGRYGFQLELKRREEAKLAREALEREQAKLNRVADEAGVARVEIPKAISTPKKIGPVRTESGTASVRTKWDFVVVDEAAVPRSYLMVNRAAIDAAIAAGIREIEGVRIYERPLVSVRRN